MHPLLKKLQYKGQAEIHVLGAPPELAKTLGELAREVVVVTDPKSKKALEIGLFFVPSRADAAAVAKPVVGRAGPASVLWFAYPKKTSKRYAADITRDDGWQPMHDLGYRPVSLVSLDDDWSALRFRPTDVVKASR